MRTKKQFSFILFACLFSLSVMAQDVVEPYLHLDTRMWIEPAEALNSKNLESSPVLYENGLVFVFARERSKLLDPKIGMPFFELMYSDIGPDGTPRRAVSFSPNVRSRYHEGPAAFTNDFSEIFFTRSNAKNGEGVVDANRKINLKIFSAKKGLEDWEKIKELPFCRDEYSVCHPTLSSDGNRLVFSSNLPGGVGGMDLYMIERINGEWQIPINLGEEINTEDNEIFPVWHESGTLFFSSDGHPGFGGLDIFAAKEEGSKFVRLTALPKPINSRNDDLGFTLDATGKYGLFASSRKGGKGKDDIYIFRSDESIFDIPAPVVAEDVELFVTDRQTDEGLNGAYVWLFEVGPAGPIGIDSLYETKLIRNKDVEGEITLRMRRVTKLKDIEPHFIADENGIIVTQLLPTKEYLALATSDGYVTEEVLLKRPIGSFNGMHSIRLDAVPVEAPPEPDCVIVQGRVMSGVTNQPLANALIELSSSCGEAPKLIRSDADGRYQFCLSHKCTFDGVVSLDGYLTHSYTFQPSLDDNPLWSVYLDEAIEDLPTLTEPIREGVVIVLENIYYDFNKSAIQSGAARELDALAGIMRKYPSMTIELSAHTDARGKEEYNLELSEKRAFSAKDYLVARGVDGRRIQTKAMGESQIRNHCVNGVQCTDEEHRYNRRSEVKVLTIDQEVQIRYGGGN